MSGIRILSISISGLPVGRSKGRLPHHVCGREFVFIFIFFFFCGRDFLLYVAMMVLILRSCSRCAATQLPIPHCTYGNMRSPQDED